MKLRITLRCHVCGSVEYESWAEADKRAESHTKLTGHPTSVEVVAC